MDNVYFLTIDHSAQSVQSLMHIIGKSLFYPPNASSACFLARFYYSYIAPVGDLFLSAFSTGAQEPVELGFVLIGMHR